MKADNPLFTYSSRIAIGLAATGGIMCAACVSGLPTTPCKAMAHLYASAICYFGTAGFSGLAILGGLAFPDRETDRQHKIDRIFIWFFIGLGFLSILVGFFHSLFLRGIIDQCWH